MEIGVHNIRVLICNQVTILRNTTTTITRTNRNLKNHLLISLKYDKTSSTCRKNVG